MKLTVAVATLAVIAAVVVLARREEPVRAGSTNTSLNQKVDPMQTKQAIFAAGCFWGVETMFRKVDGVVSTTVGYAGGKTDNPSYEDVCTDQTGHAEAVLVTYDPAKVSYPELLDAFWSLHDPTTVDRQGPDVGTQYRSVIFYHDAEQEKLARASLKEVDDSGVFKRKIATQIVPAGKFYKAEDYHQQYFEKHGRAESCHVGIAEVHTKLAKQAAEERKGSTPTPTTQATR